MEDHIRYAERLGADYAELTFVTSRKRSLETSNNELKEISSGGASGYGARVFCKGGVGSAYSNKEDFRGIIRDAVRNARACTEKTEIDLQKPARRRFRSAFKIDPDDISFEEKRDLMLGIKKGGYRSIKNLSMSYADIKKYTHFVNSEGRNLEWDDTITYALCSTYAKKGSRAESFYDMKAEHAGFELMDGLDALCDEVMKTNTELLSAKNARKGDYPVVCDQKLGGVLAHEATGHACEADIVLDKASVLKDKKGAKIASGIVDIYDDGSMEDKWGWTPFDSEGIFGQKTALLKSGVVSSYLQSRITARKLGCAPTGNGRSQSIGHKVIPRMTNTFVGPGDSTFEEMVRSIKSGYYLKRSSGGQVDPSTGEFLFNALESFSIESGEIAGRVKGVSMIGNILTTLKEISLIADDIIIEGGGACGKAGQYVLAGDGSPHIKIDRVKIGGTD